jgi:hypothetical protein
MNNILKFYTTELKERIPRAQEKALKSVNKLQINLYWETWYQIIILKIKKT